MSAENHFIQGPNEVPQCPLQEAMQELGMVADVYNPSIWEAEAGP
jgi:hypothetical protein